MDSKNDSNMALMRVNGLRYTMPQPLSTTLMRTFKKQYAQRGKYSPSETIVFDINTSGCIDPKLSYLRFDVAIKGTTGGETAGFGGFGSAVNLIRDLRIQSKSGRELDRIQSLNHYSVYRTNYELDNKELENNKEETGYNTGNAGLTANATAGVFGVAQTFIIPCCWLSGLFRPHVKDQKIPPMLLSGARIELELESCLKALVGSADSVSDYEITSPTFMFMEHTLNDSTLKVLTETSANNGLEYVYDRVFTSIETTGAATDYTLQVKKSVSQATQVFTGITRSAAKTQSQDDFLGTSIAGLENFQYRLGSNYFPHQVVDNSKEAFRITKNAFNAQHNAGVATIDYTAWAVGTDTSLLVVAVPLKTDNEITSSGLAVNNSQVVELIYKGDNVDKRLFTFMTYTSLARSFLSNTEVKI